MSRLCFWKPWKWAMKRRWFLNVKMGALVLLLDPRTEERTRAVAALSLVLLGGAVGAEGLLTYLAPESDARFQGGIRRRVRSSLP